MPLTIEGTLSARGLRFAIVASRFNGLIVEPLIAGALDAIVRSGGDADAVTIVRCPGAWELPQVVKKVIARGGIDAVIALGAVIRGATAHFEYVAGEAAHGIAAAAVAGATDVAVSFGVLTTETIEQALERAGTKAGNKGFDTALAAIELANLFRALAPVAVAPPPPLPAALPGSAADAIPAVARAAAIEARKRGRRG
ncbi:MAG TPA: 6,7-dimethyl-8-ribityllumazine synthase [Kofleriaceae bacterium]|jgi:6,7-dimethyl-8-ribityllumazine synthase|nr:6,7-dimethyl-8-ribityllumazine synthase [Kofleriaceae bacterium]